MAESADIVASLARVDEVARVLAVALGTLPEGCTGDEARAEPAMESAVIAAHSYTVSSAPPRAGMPSSSFSIRSC